MVKLMLDTILFVSNDVISELEFSLEGFGINGLDSVAGDNVSVVVQ